MSGARPEDGQDRPGRHAVACGDGPRRRHAQHQQRPRQLKGRTPGGDQRGRLPRAPHQQHEEEVDRVPGPHHLVGGVVPQFLRGEPLDGGPYQHAENRQDLGPHQVIEARTPQPVRWISRIICAEMHYVTTRVDSRIGASVGVVRV